MKNLNLFSLLLIFSLFCFACSDKADIDPVIEDEELPSGFNPVEEEAFAFPGAEGFGKVATGGRGGNVIKVTNLNDSGAGSFRQAIITPGARIIVFEVSGNIELASNIVIGTGNVTVAGQTAPGDGITLKNHSLIVNADNVIIRYMRFRMGDEGAAEADALEGRYKKNIIIDHCSMSWSTDETASFYGNENFTMQWCILSESLTLSVHEKGKHGYGGIWGGKNASFHHNLLAHHDNRNPRFDHPGVYNATNSVENLRGVVDFRNNVIYNWGTDAAYGGEAGTFNLVNNFFKPGPASKNKSMFLNAYKQASNSAPVYGYGKFFVEGNKLDGRDDISADNWLGVVAKQGSATDKANMKLDSPLDFGTYGFVHNAVQAYEKVLEFGGASYKRDLVDLRVLADVKNGSFTAEGSRGSTNGLIDSQQDVGGWPMLNSLPAHLDTDNDGMPDDWEKANGLDPNKNDAKERNLSTAYDNIEVYINSLVKDITQGQYGN
ncbi:pectate lyase [Belliella marina]|uniref:Pectate lyase n=1 Tax=Belliella marina TaxID=1644146 RepID=A0ABW4VGF9_9BACT